LYYGVLQNKNISTTSIPSSPAITMAATNNPSAAISAESKKKSKSTTLRPLKYNMKSNLRSATKSISTHLPIQKLPPKKQDGCSVNDKVLPKWAPHSNPQEQTKFMNQAFQCVRRISPHEPVQQVSTDIAYLHCNAQASLDILKQYRRVWFIGDSVLLQQYRSLLCTLDTQLQSYQLQFRKCGEEMTYKHDLGETSLVYTEFGWIFDQEEPLYKTVFPEAIATSTQADAIVLNAGLHYDVTRGHLLQKSMDFIQQQASKTNSSIHFMEASNEQWPTSNGIWTSNCTGTCQCEVLTPERRQGHGSWGQHHAEVSHDIGLLPQPLESTYGNLYPELFVPSNQNHPAHCVPSCLPANWRNDIVHSVLTTTPKNHDRRTSNSNTNHDNLYVVPIWNQLVAQNQLHNRELGDCTHKSLEAVHMMNEQLFRSLTLAAQPNQRRGIQEPNPAPPTTCTKGVIGGKRSTPNESNNEDVSHSSDFQSGVLGATQEGASLDNHNNNNNDKLRVIVTGMEHTGTTILSELIMSAPGLIGPFETGFLLAETPSDFRQVTPFFEWVSRTDVKNAFLGLSSTQVQTLLQQPTHRDMYTYAMENSMFFKNIPSQWYVDKTPSYVYSLQQVMERAGPGVKVVVSMKSYEAAYKSWVTRRNASEAEFKAAYQLFQSSVQEASKAFPGQIYLQDYGDLFGNYIKGNKTLAYVSGKLLFDWLGLEWKNEYFTGKACADKGRPCNMASLFDH